MMKEAKCLLRKMFNRTANIGWSIGEKYYLIKTLDQTKSCIAEVESCLLGILKSKLAII